MNKAATISVMIVVAGLAMNCSGEKKGMDGNDVDTTAVAGAEGRDWKEMDDFHMVMAEAFHPYKDESDLAPAKQKASELAASADRWAASTLPEKVNTQEMKDKLQQLRKETKEFENVVKTETDQLIGEKLTRVHDLFHEIQESWYGHGDHAH
jgi:hypothetical protein